MTLEMLTDILSAAGGEHHVIRRGGGAYVVIPQGARILGVYPSSDGSNLFWGGEPCGTSESFKAAVAGELWNFGGDRLWFSPEMHLFVRTSQATMPEYVPAAMDPGRYSLEVCGDRVVMRQSGSLADGRTGQLVRFEVERSVRPIEPPLQDVDGAIQYIGYETISRMEATTDEPPAPRINLWQLFQVPSPGQIVISTRGPGRPYDFFGTGTDRWCRVTEEGVVFPVTGQCFHKIGVSGAEVSGRVGYFRRLSADHASLLVRNFLAVPGAYYPDFPVGDPSRRCFAVQCYNDGGQFGGFGEVEHHSPSVASGPTGCTSIDIAQLWCFSGPSASIRRIGEALLGPVASGVCR